MSVSVFGFSTTRYQRDPLADSGFPLIASFGLSCEESEDAQNKDDTDTFTPAGPFRDEILLAAYKQYRFRLESLAIEITLNWNIVAIFGYYNNSSVRENVCNNSKRKKLFGISKFGIFEFRKNVKNVKNVRIVSQATYTLSL